MSLFLPHQFSAVEDEPGPVIALSLSGNHRDPVQKANSTEISSCLVRPITPSKQLLEKNQPNHFQEEVCEQ